MSEPMTAQARREFVQFTRQYVRGIKTRGEAHAAQLALACEEELSRVYEKHDEAWASAVAEAERKINEAEAEVNAHIETVFAERGLMNQRRMPSYIAFHGWVERGETFDKDRRAELRKVAQAQAKLLAKAAVAKGEEVATEFEQRMLTEEWTREQALQAARDLPRAEQLMPPLDPQRVHEIARQEHHQRNRYGSSWPELMPGELEVQGDE